MFDNWMTRGVLALALVAGTAGVVVAEGSTAASAASSPLICKKFFGHTTSKVVIAKCVGVKGSAHFAGSDILTGGTLTWGKTGLTTSYTGSATSPGEGSCPVGRVEYDFTGSVTDDTSTYVDVGDTVTYDICVNSTTHVVKLIRMTTSSF